jgi:hypothetical protein
VVASGDDDGILPHGEDQDVREGRKHGPTEAFGDYWESKGLLKDVRHSSYQGIQELLFYPCGRRSVPLCGFGHLLECERPDE